MADEDKLLTHDYDGIQEYDNDLPRWWKNIFWVTTVFGLFYAGWVHLGFKEPQHAQLARELSELDEQRAAIASETGNQEFGEAQMLALTKDSEVVQKGKDIFAAKCAACHGLNAEGLVGPNLTDEYWIHGASITDILHIVRVGVPEKGMLSWETMMSEDEIRQVVSYVWTLQGSNPANPKAPEGQLSSKG
ncbi:MAG: c-type cytochrome [Bdellovibrionales bacterium]|nr:c-type cytochrome [Bdellovibrionales bacterium]